MTTESATAADLHQVMACTVLQAMTISADMGLKSFTEQEAIAEPAAVGDVVGDVEEDAVNEEDMADGADDDNDDFVWTSPPYFHAAAAEPRR